MYKGISKESNGGQVTSTDDYNPFTKMSIEPENFNPSSKNLNVNRYATKKTIAQGMLDIALLTANASQLRYVLSLGPDKHEFYALMLGLIITSLILQVVFGLVAAILIPMDISRRTLKYVADNTNHFSMGTGLFIMATDLVKMGFGSGYLPHKNETHVLVGILFLVMGAIDINNQENHLAANILNNIIVLFIFIISVMNVVINGFGIEQTNRVSPGTVTKHSL